MKKGLTIITRGVVYLMGIAVLTICGILLPEIAREETVANPTSDPLMYPSLVGAWILAIPIFVALHQTHKLISHIDGNNAFSGRSVKALQNIKVCAIVFGALIILGATSVIAIARSANPGEDVTHIVTLGFVFTFVSIVIATFAAVLQRLLQDAIKMKSENDLTV